MPATDDLPEALARLVALGQSPDINIRPVLLRVVVDMFIQKQHHAPSDLQQFETIVGHLLDDADLDARLIVAEKLSRHPATPRVLLDRFVAEHGVIAAQVYEHAMLEPGVLTAAAIWGPADIAQAIARRPDLSAEVVSALAERPEPEVVRQLAANADVVLDRESFRHLVRLARDDAQLAHHLVDKTADPIDMAPLFPLVRTEQREAIIEAARRLELGKRQWGRLDVASPETLAHMDRLMLSGERDSFEHALCMALGVDWAVLLPLLHDDGGEILALALAAIGTHPDMAARVFILGDPRIGRSIMRVRSLTEIVETVPAHAARRLIGAMSGGTPNATRRGLRPTPPSSRRIDTPEHEQAAAVKRDQTAPTPARRQG